jgi:hypothetical protein
MSTVFQSSNEFGEKQNNTMTTEQIESLSEVLAFPEIAAGSIMVNPEVTAAIPVAKTVQQVSNLLPSKAGVTAISAIAVADAPAQGIAYVQADVQAIATLANANKAKINAILAALKVVS